MAVRRGIGALGPENCLQIATQFTGSAAVTGPILERHAFAMAEPLDPADRPSRLGRTTVARVLGNAALLTFATLLVVSVATGRVAGSLLWGGALLVFFAPALDRPQRAAAPPSARTRLGDALRWCGLALAVAGAAALLA
jgi:hypothetical protein